MWTRKRVFDRHIAAVLFEMAVSCRQFTVTDMCASPRTKAKPLPLTTVRVRIAVVLCTPGLTHGRLRLSCKCGRPSGCGCPLIKP